MRYIIAICSVSRDARYIVPPPATVTSHFELSQGARVARTCIEPAGPLRSGRSAAWELAACDPLTPCKRLNGLFNAHTQERETFLYSGKRVERPSSLSNSPCVRRFDRFAREISGSSLVPFSP